jgi:hypothetical protein
MAEETEREKHLHKVIAFERKQSEEQIRRYHTRIDQLEKLAHKNHAIRLVEILEEFNWEASSTKLTKAQAKGAEYVVKLLRGLAEAKLDEHPGQESDGK